MLIIDRVGVVMLEKFEGTFDGKNVQNDRKTDVLPAYNFRKTQYAIYVVLK